MLVREDFVSGSHGFVDINAGIDINLEKHCVVFCVFHFVKNEQAWLRANDLPNRRSRKKSLTRVIKI